MKVRYRPRQWAKPFHAWRGRWAALVLHRRAGKTTSILNQHLRYALDTEQEVLRLRFLAPDLTEAQIRPLLRSRFYAHVLPTYKQAKLTAWELLKHYSQGLATKTNESDLMVTYPTGSRIALFGADNPDSLRGVALSGLSLDEYGLHPPHSFSEVLSKALADHLGYCVFAGTIKGENHLYRTYQAAAGDSSWFALWQDVTQSLDTEQDAATRMLRQAMLDDQALIAKGLMTQAEYDQEWYLSTTAAIKGAYYGAEMAAAKADRRITRVPFDPDLPVDTDWDLGMDDATAIVFSQSLRSKEVRIIDYYEASGEGLSHYARVLQEKAAARGYVYGAHWAPHDIQVRELGTGKSRLETAKALGIAFHIVPALPLADGIDAVRRLIPRCWFDETACAPLITALTQYRKTFHERLQQFTDHPVHDWTSHPADAMRGLAVRWKPPVERKKGPHPFVHAAGHGAGWMG